MTIAEQVNQIIACRAKRLPAIDHKMTLLKDALEHIDVFERVRAQMIDATGEPLQNGKYAPLLSAYSTMAGSLQQINTASCKDALKHALFQMEEYRRRNARESVQISVIGNARCGKSLVLQNFSGLDNKVIPSSSSSDCTGATSIIRNEKGTQLRATITFKTEDQMRALAQAYLTAMIPDAQKRPMLFDMQSIKTLDMETVEKARAACGGEGVFLKPLTVMKNFYEEWACYAGKAPQVITDPDVICTFVAQHNDKLKGSPLRVEYHKYFVVDTCTIECEFPQQDLGKISLIDTIGINDTKLGLAESMMNTVTNESDAVVFVIMPRSGAGEGIPDDVNAIHSKIAKVCADRNLNAWLFPFLNHVIYATEKEACNTEHVNSAKEKIISSKWMCNTPVIISPLLEKEKTRAFLAQMLEKLLLNLDSIDHIFYERAEVALKDAGIAYGELCRQLKNVSNTNSLSSQSTINLINQLFHQKWGDIRVQLTKLRSAWKAMRDESCGAIYRPADQILSDMSIKQKLLPTIDDIKAEQAMGTQSQQILINYMNALRNQIALRFLDIDRELTLYVNSMKEQVADALCHRIGFEKIYPLEENESLLQWLEAFDAQLEENQADYPHLSLAVHTIAHYQLSVKGFLTYEIRMALNALDPDEGNLPNIISPKAERIPVNIQSVLLQRLVATSTVIRSAILELSKKPNRALFAEVDTFCDHMLYMQDIQMEWNRFLVDHNAEMWGCEIRQNQSRGALDDEWNHIVKNVTDGNRAASFQLSQA